jgi:tetratricopeptide (TPR) repeat protein
MLIFMTNTISRIAFLLAISLLAFSGCTKVHSSTPQAASPDDGKSATILNGEAYDLISKREYTTAIEKLERALKLDPKMAEAHKNLALAYCDSGHAEQGLNAAEQAVSLAPNLDKAHFVLGKILVRLGRLDDSIKQFQRAIALNPKYHKAYYWLGLAYDRANDIPHAQATIGEALKLNPDEIEYRGRSECLKLYAAAEASGRLPAFRESEISYEYSTALYAQIFYEALLHQNYDLLERATEQARSSREILKGGRWKLQYIYDGISNPLDPEMSSDAEWLGHLGLLKRWVELKPQSITARIALAAGYIKYGWHARGTGPAITVSAENQRLLTERLTTAKDVLSAVPMRDIKCPQWYSLMQTIALSEGWDRESYDELFDRAVAFEPAWESFYGAKAIYLLPRWHGSAPELHDFLNGLLSTPDKHGALHYFLACQTIADYAQQEFLFDQKVATAKLKEGLKDLQRTYGATMLDLNWACFTAMRLGDKAFTRDLLAQIKENWYASVWLNEEGFSIAKKWASS